MNKKYKSRTVIWILTLIMVHMQGCTYFAQEFEKGFKQPFPTDDEMTAIFNSNQADFDELVRMSNEDESVYQIAMTFTYVKGMVGSSNDTGVIGFSKERWDDYRNKFERLRLPAGLFRSDAVEGEIYFNSYSSFISKGYLYSPKTRECTDPSLNDRTILRDKPFLCKQLQPHWYIFMQK